MKNSALFIVALVFTFSFTQAQKCKFEKQENDPFGGGSVLHSQIVSMLSLMSESRFDIQVQKSGENYGLYVYANITSADPLAFSVQKGQQLLFLLENKDTVQVHSKETVFGKQPMVNDGMSSLAMKSYIGNIYNTYEINAAQLEKIKASPVQIIRIYFTASDARELKADYDKKLSKSGKEKLPLTIDCVLSN
ncbi:MAG: hypothetical protein IPI23_16080 [Bacteroidetes bacterium]|nr:hypothetical protein [Bacteroidota bacterium]